MFLQLQWSHPVLVRILDVVWMYIIASAAAITIHVLIVSPFFMEQFIILLHSLISSFLTQKGLPWSLVGM